MLALQTAFARCRSGQSNGVLISGAPGIGKTALVNEVRPFVSAAKGWYVASKFDQYGQDGLTAAQEALRALGRLLLAEPDHELARLRERIVEGSNGYLGFGPTQLPEFELLLGKQPRISITNPRDAEALLLRATVELVRSIASAARPLVIFYDDLHGCPEPSFDSLTHSYRRKNPLRDFS